MRQARDAFGRELQRHALGGQQRLVLAHQRGVCLREDGFKVLHRERIELHADREAPLQLGNQVAGLGQVEGAGGNEQDVVGLDHAVLGVHRGAFHQRQQIALHALARHIGAAALLARGHLVDLVDEDDAVLLGAEQGALLDLFLIDQLGRFFLDKLAPRFSNAELARLALALTDLAEHAAQLLGHVLHACGAHDFELWAGLGQVDLDLLVVELALAQLLAEHLARGAVGWRLAAGRARHGDEHVQDALLGRVFGARAHLARLHLALLLDGHFHQVADDGVHVLAHIAHLGELGGLDLDEGRIGQACQAPRDFGLAHARGADHEDVLGRDFVAQGLLHLLAAPAVAQRNGHGPLGLGLADDVAVQLGNDFLGGHGRHGENSNQIGT